MKTRTRSLRSVAVNGGEAPLQNGYFLTEVLVYFGVLLILMAIGYAAVYRCIDNSVALRRSAEDITRALQAGERWRADVRGADRSARLEQTDDQEILLLEGMSRLVAYRFGAGTVSRRVNEGPWVRVLEKVRSSQMNADQRATVRAWRWDLELQPQTKGSVKPGRFRPLFTILAVPAIPAP